MIKLAHVDTKMIVALESQLAKRGVSSENVFFDLWSDLYYAGFQVGVSTHRGWSFWRIATDGPEPFMPYSGNQYYGVKEVAAAVADAIVVTLASTVADETGRKG